MKRVGYLYEDAISLENIEKAIIDASKGKTKRRDVRKVLARKDEYALYIHEALKNGIYIFDKGKPKIIKETHKERSIVVPRFVDLIVQYAILEKLKPILMRGMYKWSCGNVNGRGVLYAKKYTEVVVKKYKPKYALKLDIRKFYHNIDINILMKMLERKIKDKKFLNLIYEVLKVGSIDGKGLPIGFYTSQWLSNFYLEGLDNYIKQKLGIKYYVRYVDDMVLFGNNKRKLHQAKKLIEQYLSGIELDLKDNWQVFPIKNRPVDFVGYKISYTNIKIRKRTLKMIKRRKRKILSGKINIFIAQSFISYLGWYKHTKKKLTKDLKKAFLIAKGYVSRRALKHIKQRQVGDY